MERWEGQGRSYFEFLEGELNSWIADDGVFVEISNVDSNLRRRWSSLIMRIYHDISPPSYVSYEK